MEGTARPWPFGPSGAGGPGLPGPSYTDARTSLEHAGLAPTWRGWPLGLGVVRPEPVGSGPNTVQRMSLVAMTREPPSCPSCWRRTACRNFSCPA